MFDVAIVGSGPAGSSCAAFCANAGLQRFSWNREIFPARKSLRRLFEPGVLADFAAAPVNGTRPDIAARRARSRRVHWHRGRTLAVTLPAGDEAEIAVKRSLFDQLIMRRARELGATICEGAP